MTEQELVGLIGSWVGRRQSDPDEDTKELIDALVGAIRRLRDDPTEAVQDERKACEDIARAEHSCRHYEARDGYDMPPLREMYLRGMAKAAEKITDAIRKRASRPEQLVCSMADVFPRKGSRGGP